MKNLDRVLTTGIIWGSTAYMRSVGNELFWLIMVGAILTTVFVWLSAIQINKGE